MTTTAPTTMRAAAIDEFGGAENIHVETLPYPITEPDEVLIRVK